MKIYKMIYYYFFLKSSKKNTVPEVPVYTLLSLTQTSNLITITNIIMIVTRMNINYDVGKIVLIGPVLFYLINHYYFSTKGNGAIIIKDDSYSLGKYSFLLRVFNISSHFIMILTYYFYKES
ncbi:hypothetical protein QWY99_21350 [Flavobacterium branchiarum]|uniref:Uncharacterized protein n=1 Tax=Flavobacterium branchiarum TaxID=1114870 RepID=A0ABV5FPP5_9FLAO|nr:hypothetical protein [Flavobacterium branchiarum]MDN3675582.1 hypothetical protein [Flavobacterium branchiarum]